MAFQRRRQADRTQESEGDLNKLLTEAQRTDLVALLEFTMTVMQQTICSQTNGSDLAAQATADTQEAGGEQSGESRITKAVLRAEARAVEYFDAWRESVIGRIYGVLAAAGSGPAEQGAEQADELEDTQSSLQQSSPARVDHPSRVHLEKIFPPIKTPLSHLPLAKRRLVLRSLLLLILGLEKYSAHSRVLLVLVACNLGLSPEDLTGDETAVARALLASARKLSAADETAAHVQKSQSSKRWKVGLVSVAGAALIGVTGGLAAPFVAAGLGAIMGGLGLGGTLVATYLGALASSGFVIGGLFGAYGGRMTGEMMERYSKEVEDFAFIPIHRNESRQRGVPWAMDVDPDPDPDLDHQLRVTIGISGWLTDERDFVDPWLTFGRATDTFALRWEFAVLLRLGTSLSAVVKSAAWTLASRQIVAGTMLAPIVGALMLPIGLLKLGKVVDNPFRVAKTRADKAGAILADALINRAQGERPVTLVGYSFGARVVFACLLTLAQRRAYGLVEAAVLIGAPVTADVAHWRLLRTAVSGRLVNVYSTNDAVLAFLYRLHSVEVRLAGLHPVQAYGTDAKASSGVQGEIENFDFSSSVTGHLRYRFMVGTILAEIGFGDLDQTHLRRQREQLRVYEEQEHEQEREQQWERTKAAAQMADKSDD